MKEGAAVHRCDNWLVFKTGFSRRCEAATRMILFPRGSETSQVPHWQNLVKESNHPSNKGRSPLRLETVEGTLLCDE